MAIVSAVPSEWDPTGQTEPPAAVLRRAISHVESLLQRVEPSAELSPADITPISANVARTAQGEALRVLLRAHEEECRSRAEADRLRAAAVAEGERIVAEARELSYRLYGVACARAAEMVATARSAAEALTEAARVEAAELLRDEAP